MLTRFCVKYDSVIQDFKYVWIQHLPARVRAYPHQLSAAFAYDGLRTND